MIVIRSLQVKIACAYTAINSSGDLMYCSNRGPIIFHTYFASHLIHFIQFSDLLFIYPDTFYSSIITIFDAF